MNSEKVSTSGLFTAPSGAVVPHPPPATGGAGCEGLPRPAAKPAGGLTVRRSA